eukprot:g3467.t1
MSSHSHKRQRVSNLIKESYEEEWLDPAEAEKYACGVCSLVCRDP